MTKSAPYAILTEPVKNKRFYSPATSDKIITTLVVYIILLTNLLFNIIYVYALIWTKHC